VATYRRYVEISPQSHESDVRWAKRKIKELEGKQ
jgi:hypothetical protein